MIRPPGLAGAAFSDGTDGDLRSNERARSLFAERSGAPPQWATVRQIHGNQVLSARGPGQIGDGDAVWTSTPGLGVAIFTADCFGVVVHATTAVGVAHAGWRGADAGVVLALLAAMVDAGHTPERAAIGPGIGPCCFEVGPEVSDRFPSHVSTTSWGSSSVDLPSVVADQLVGLDVWVDGSCTMDEPDLFSYRGNATSERMAAIGWI